MPDHDLDPTLDPTLDQPLVADLDISVVRLDPDLPLPSYAHPGDAGADLHTTSDLTLAPGERARFVEGGVLPDSPRGAGGYGSTGTGSRP